MTRKSECSSAVLNDRLTVSASASLPKGVRKKDFEFRVAAIVRAASKHPNMVASRHNLAVCTSLHVFGQFVLRKRQLSRTGEV